MTNINISSPPKLILPRKRPNPIKMRDQLIKLFLESSDKLPSSEEVSELALYALEQFENERLSILQKYNTTKKWRLCGLLLLFSPLQIFLEQFDNSIAEILVILLMLIEISGVIIWLIADMGLMNLYTKKLSDIYWNMLSLAKVYEGEDVEESFNENWSTQEAIAYLQSEGVGSESKFYGSNL